MNSGYPWQRLDHLPAFVKFGRHIHIGGDPKRKEYMKGISWDLRKYQQAVLQVLRRLHGNTVGRIILDAIQKRVMITPRNIGYMYGAQVFATTGQYLYDPDHAEDRAMLISVSKDSNHAAMRKGVKDRYGVGTGAGSNAVEIDFVPATFSQTSAINHMKKSIFTPEGALLHELVHAVRMHRGQLDTRIFKGYQSVYQDKEEFLAVLVANLYRSTVGARSDGLRWKYEFDYYKTQTMQDIGGTPYDAATFAETFKPLLAALYLEIPKLLANLAAVPCDFNPVTYACKDFSAMTTAEVAKIAKSSETYYTVGELLPDWYPR